MCMLDFIHLTNNVARFYASDIGTLLNIDKRFIIMISNNIILDSVVFKLVKWFEE